MSTSSVETIFTDDLTDTRDKRLKALQRAKEIWSLAHLAERAEKLVWAHELHGHQLFSLNQIAKICRLSVPLVCRNMKKNAIGGRFEPEVLSSVIYLRKVVIAQEQIPTSLVRTAVSSGTSVSVIARLTGASETTLYTKAK